MDLTIDLSIIVQSVLAASFVWYGRQVREVVTMIKLHEWRIEKLEEMSKVSTKCP